MTGNDDGGADADCSNGGNNNDGRGDDGNDGTVDHD